jgi:hypothetical protein
LVVERIKPKTQAISVSVLIEQGQGKHFADSVGPMGDFRSEAYVFAMASADANALVRSASFDTGELSLFQTSRLLSTKAGVHASSSHAGSCNRRSSDRRRSISLLQKRRASTKRGQGGSR